METLTVPVMSLRTRDKIKVGLERFEDVTHIDDREQGVVKVVTASGVVHTFGYHDLATVRLVSSEG